MEGIDPQKLIPLHREVVEALLEYQDTRKAYLEMQHAADVAAKLAAEALGEMEKAWTRYDKASKSIEQNARERREGQPDPALSEGEEILKRLGAQ